MWKKHQCACLCKCANWVKRMDVCIVELTARGNRNVVLLFSQGVSLPSLLTCTCFRITMPVSTLAKNKQTPCSIFKSPAPQNRNPPPHQKKRGYRLCKRPRQLQKWEKKHKFTLLHIFCNSHSAPINKKSMLFIPHTLSHSQPVPLPMYKCKTRL